MHAIQVRGTHHVGCVGGDYTILTMSGPGVFACAWAWCKYIPYTNCICLHAGTVDLVSDPSQPVESCPDDLRVKPALFLVARILQPLAGICVV